MPRPRKCRRVGFIPHNQAFYPHEENVAEVMVSIEEVEAIRLSDLEEMEQEEAALIMNISRGTFQRILKSAREKIADALINGKTIRIQGGNYEFVGRKGLCRKFRGNRS